MSVKRLTMLCLLSAVITALSCSTGTARAEGKCPVVRYVNLSAVSSYIDSTDPEYARILKDRDLASRKMKAGQSNSERGPISEDTKSEAVEATILENAESMLSSYRANNLKRINLILKKLAAEEGVDFILNYSEHVIYADSSYDLTSQVIRELEKQSKLNSPLLR